MKSKLISVAMIAWVVYSENRGHTFSKGTRNLTLMHIIFSFSLLLLNRSYQRHWLCCRMLDHPPVQFLNPAMYRLGEVELVVEVFMVSVVMLIPDYIWSRLVYMQAVVYERYVPCWMVCRMVCTSVV